MNSYRFLLLINFSLFSPQSDFLLVILRDMVKTYPDLRVVLMSATIDTTLFSEYFGNCPVLEVEGRTFPVESES